LEDKELIELFNQEESKNYAFNLIIKTYQERVYWQIRKMVIDHEDADDLTQETFIKVFKNLSSFKGDSQLFTWIYRIATNNCLSFLKKKKRINILRFSSLESDLMESVASNYSGDTTDPEYLLQQALVTLPEKQRMVFNMKYFDNLAQRIQKKTITSDSTEKQRSWLWKPALAFSLCLILGTIVFYKQNDNTPKIAAVQINDLDQESIKEYLETESLEIEWKEEDIFEQVSQVEDLDDIYFDDLDEDDVLDELDVLELLEYEI